MKKIKILTAWLFFLSIFSLSYAEIINSDLPIERRWKEGRAEKEAYRPSPIVFSHGFAAGSALTDWAEEKNQPMSQRVNMDVALSDYFGKYYCNSESETQKPIFALKDTTRYPYLELVSYIDFSKNQRSQLIDRNSSVDTYKMGDYYVYHYERNPGDIGWADKLNSAMTKVRDNYTDKNNYPLKANIVCHSMGGLAAREYLTNSKYGSSQDKVRDLVLIGVPNKGSNCAIAGTVVTKTQETGWFIPEYGWLSSTVIKLIDKTLEVTLKIDIEGDAIRDMDPLFGSGFLKQLNSRSQPAGVDYYAICGKINKGFFNGIKNIIGDGVVPVDSQLGTGVLNLKDSTVIPAGHGDETRVIAQDNASQLIKFLDSEKPVVEITEPDPQSITETYESSIKIKGKVSREYLPADSLLQIEAVNQDTGEKAFETNSRELYPSDLWVPSDPNSVVAEFEKEIPLTAPGKYKITCKIQNPAKLTSEIKEVWVKKLQIEGSNIIVHCHNPEGKEIGSITGVNYNDITIYDGNNLCAYGAFNLETHNRPIEITAGNHTIKVKFNGIVMEQAIVIADEQTLVLIFNFQRTEISPEFFNGNVSVSVTKTDKIDTYPGAGIMAMSGDNSYGRYVFNIYGDPPTATISMNGTANMTKSGIEYTISRSSSIDSGNGFFGNTNNMWLYIDRQHTIIPQNFDNWYQQQNLTQTFDYATFIGSPEENYFPHYLTMALPGIYFYKIDAKKNMDLW